MTRDEKIVLEEAEEVAADCTDKTARYFAESVIEVFSDTVQERDAYRAALLKIAREIEAPCADLNQPIDRISSIAQRITGRHFQKLPT